MVFWHGAACIPDARGTKLNAELCAALQISSLYTKPGNIDPDHLVDQKRRGSLPVSAMWRQTGARRGALDHPKDLRKLLDKKSNELLQQRQQYRIFENKFQGEVNRCSKLEQDTECLKQLLVDLLGIHGRFHRSYVLPCSNFSAVLFLVLIFLTLIVTFVFAMNDYQF